NSPIRSRSPGSTKAMPLLSSDSVTIPQGPTPPAPGRPLEERRLNAWIGASVIFKGELTSSEDMTIDGRVEGRIELHDCTLTVGPAAQIAADILAKRVTVFGAVTGTIMAGEMVDVRASATVHGDIVTTRLAVDEGATIRGRVETSPADARQER